MYIASGHSVEPQAFSRFASLRARIRRAILLVFLVDDLRRTESIEARRYSG